MFSRVEVDGGGAIPDVHPRILARIRRNRSSVKQNIVVLLHHLVDELDAIYHDTKKCPHLVDTLFGLSIDLTHMADDGPDLVLHLTRINQKMMAILGDLSQCMAASARQIQNTACTQGESKPG